MRFILIFLTIFFVTGCGESKEKASSKSTSKKNTKKMGYATELIPNHAIGIMTINPANMSIKTDLTNNIRRTFNLLSDAGAPMEFDSDDYDYDLDLMLDAINPLDDMFAYMYRGDGTGPYFCVSMDIKSSDAFENYITKSNQYAMFHLDIQEKEKYSYTQIEGGPTSAALAWDDKKALFIIGDYLRAEVRYLFELNNKLSNDQFDDFFNNSGDIGLWIDNSKLIPYATEIFTILSGGDRYIANYLAEMFSAPSEHFENSSTGINFFFNKKGMRMEIKDYANDFITDINNELFKNFDSDILTYIPNKSLLSLSMSLDFQALYESIYMDEIWEEEGLSQHEFEAIFEEKTDIDFNKLINAIGGSLVFNFSGVNESRIPELTFAMNHNDKALVSKMLGVFIDMDLLEADCGGNCYAYNYPPLYIAYNEDVIVGSFEKHVIRQVKNKKGIPNNLSSTDIGDKMDDSFLYALMNLNLSDWPSDMSEEIRSEFRSNNDRRIFNRGERMLESFEVVGPYNESSIALKLNMNVKGKSPLIDLIDFGLDEFEKVINQRNRYNY